MQHDVLLDERDEIIWLTRKQLCVFCCEVAVISSVKVLKCSDASAATFRAASGAVGRTPVAKIWRMTSTPTMGNRSAEQEKH